MPPGTRLDLAPRLLRLTPKNLKNGNIKYFSASLHPAAREGKKSFETIASVSVRPSVQYGIIHYQLTWASVLPSGLHCSVASPHRGESFLLPVMAPLMMLLLLASILAEPHARRSVCIKTLVKFPPVSVTPWKSRCGLLL